MDAVGEQRNSAYRALLLATFVGNLAGAMVSAPINEIAADLEVRPSAAVLVLSVFMIAMMLGSPAAGWITERVGARRALVCSMVLMAAGQIAASLSTSLVFLVAMRAVQGAACAVLPPAVQQSLVRQWPDRSGRSMAAWASAAAVGQGAGLPLGGVVADAAGWRGVFHVQALLCVLVAIAISVWVPRTPPRAEPVKRTGMLGLVVGVGFPVLAVTWAAHRGPWQGLVLMFVVGTSVGCSRLWRARRDRAATRRWVWADTAFLSGTAAAMASMFTIGTVLAGITLRLGQEYHRSPSEIGAVVVCLSLAMSVGSPLFARRAARCGPARVLTLVLAVVAASHALLALLGFADAGRVGLTATVALLIVIGGAVGALQANAAHQVMSSSAAADGSAHGMHNMLRFAGIACGYAWVAFAYPIGGSSLTFGGAAAAVACTLLVVVGWPVRGSRA